MSKNSDTKYALSVVKNDNRRGIYNSKYNSLIGEIEKINTSALSRTGLNELEKVKNSIQGVDEKFESSFDVHEADVQQRAKKLDYAIIARRVISLILLIVCITLVPNHFWAAFFLFIILLIARSVAKKVMLKKANQLKAESYALIRDANNSYGVPVHNGFPATGIHSEVDRLFLSSLTEQERLFIMSERQAERRHQESLMQQQQLQQSVDNAAAATRAYQDEMIAIQRDQTYVAPKYRYRR